MRVAVSVHLLLVLMIVAVELAVQVILVITPRHPRHQVNPIPVFAPGLDPRSHAGIEPINNRHIRPQIAIPPPGCVRLEARPLQALLRVRKNIRFAKSL